MSIFRRLAVERPGVPALTDIRQAITWAELDVLVDRYGEALSAMDLGEERRVAVFSENGIEVILAHLVAMTSGVSSMPINAHLTKDEVGYILRDSGARVIFVGPEHVDVALAAVEQLDGVTVIGWRAEHRSDVLAWETWRAAEGTVNDTVYPPRRSLLYTSGTTGSVKAVEIPPTMWPPSDTVEELATNLRARYPTADRDSLLVVSPLYHTGGLLVTRMVFLGTSAIILGRFDAEGTLRAIATYRPNTAMMVPTHFGRLLALPDEVKAKYDVSSVKQIRITGSACPVEYKRRIIEWFGPVVLEYYGATEAGATCVIDSVEWLAHPGSVGRTIEPYEVVVVDDDGNEVAPNEVGHLYFRDLTGRGIQYLNDPAKTAAAHREPGVFTLGDVGYVDPDGYVFITDRDSDMVVSGGANIYPAETERVLLEHPDVLDVACIGIPNDDMGEELRALVVPRNADNPPSAEELIAFCRTKLAGYKRPRSVEFVSDLGRNAMGKLNKRALRAPYWPTERTIGG